MLFKPRSGRILKSCLTEFCQESQSTSSTCATVTLPASRPKCLPNMCNASLKIPSQANKSKMRFSVTRIQKQVNNFHQSSRMPMTRCRERQRKKGRGQSGDPKKNPFCGACVSPRRLASKTLWKFLFATINTPRAPTLIYPRIKSKAFKCAPNVHRRSEMCTECAPNQPN